MMTIKHITEKGTEFVYPTTHIHFVPSGAKKCEPPLDSLWRYDADGRAHEMTEGTAYVMNEFGTTVARYYLSSTLPQETKQ